jgi:flagellar hook-associated protein 2
VVTQLAAAERAPETQWQSQQAVISQQNAAFTSIKANLATLQADLKALQDPSLYGSSAAQTSDASIATAVAASGATLGSFNFNISQLATAARISGTTQISQALSPDGNLNNVTIGTAGFSTPITAGTFTVNGSQVTIATTDSLQQVFDKIAAATNNAVTASYDTNTDTISLTSANPAQEVILGSAPDTSNFLQVAQLYNNGTGLITSAAALGSVRLTASMPNSDLATAVTDGGSGLGQFSINGVVINYNATTDSIKNVIDRINSSSAGVTASYDSLKNQFVVTNKVTGDIGIAMQDVTGNFLAATGLSSGALQHGQNLHYSINNGGQLVSQSNTITQDSSSLTGLSLKALTTGIVTVNVTSDTSKISAAIQNFTKDYNLAQSFISSQMAVTTAADGTVTAGILTGDQTANEIASRLRSLSFSLSVPGSTSTVKTLGDLGIQTNGQNNTLSLGDSTVLDGQLANHLNDVQAFFADPTAGLATQLNKYFDNTIGANGTLLSHQSALTKESAGFDTQIANLEKKIKADSAQLTSEFQIMEQVQARVTQQLTFLTQQITNKSF